MGRWVVGLWGDRVLRELSGEGQSILVTALLVSVKRHQDNGHLKKEAFNQGVIISEG